MESEKKVHIGNIRTLYCLFRLFSNPGPGSEPGGQSHSGLEAEGRLKERVWGGAPHKIKLIRFAKCPNCAELLQQDSCTLLFLCTEINTGVVPWSS